MNKKKLSGILALCVMAASAMANSVVYTQPFDGTGDFYASQNDIAGLGNFATVYDDFKVSGNTLITGVSWVGGYFGTPNPGNITGFTLRFWSDNAGQPGGLLQTFTAVGKANESNLGTFGGRLMLSYDMPISFQATAGTQYWLSIVPDVAYPPQWCIATGTGGDGVAYQDFFGSRLTLRNDMAFTLYTPSSLVPDGGVTVLFLGGAFALLGLLQRKLT